MQFRIFHTKWGSFGFVEQDDRLMATVLPRREARVRKEIASRWPDSIESKKLLPEFVAQVREYFKGHPMDFDVKVDLSDSPPFHKRVLEACRRIPYGRTKSYGELARSAGNAAAARAVGAAMAGNRCPLVIPCHRVLQSGGGLGGFSSENGVAEKERMLRLEGALRDDSRRYIRNHSLRIVEV